MSCSFCTLAFNKLTLQEEGPFLGNDRGQPICMYPSRADYSLSCLKRRLVDGPVSPVARRVFASFLQPLVCLPTFGVASNERYHSVGWIELLGWDPDPW